MMKYRHSQSAQYIAPMSATLTQHWANFGSMSRVCWDSRALLGSLFEEHWIREHHHIEGDKIIKIPANTKHLYNICTTSAQRLRHCTNVIQMFCVDWDTPPGTIHWPSAVGRRRWPDNNPTEGQWSIRFAWIRLWAWKKMKWNESGFRPLLCTYRLNWARRTCWGWWDDSALKTQDSRFRPWRSEAEYATSRSRRLSTILSSTSGWGKNMCVSFEPPRPGNEPRTLAWKAAVLTTTLGAPTCEHERPMREKLAAYLLVGR